MQKPGRRRIRHKLIFTLAMTIWGCSFPALGEDRDNLEEADLLQLEVYINDVTTGLIGEFHRTEDGRIMVREQELRDVGIKPNPAARNADGLIVLDRLPNVTHRYDEENQTLHFETTDDYREPRQLDARAKGGKMDGEEEEELAESSIGAYANYRLYTSFHSEEFFSGPAFQGASGVFDTVGFSPLGHIDNSFLVKTNSGFDALDTIRLSSSWNYHDQKSMISYRLGDLVSGGLQWTRPVYLGGVQIRRNFGLRPDLVTMPIPSFSGTAAVPSTLDVYTNGSRSYSTMIPGGPFEINNLPIVSGPGMARIVVRDASGREVAQDVPFFTSSKLLRPGLVDFSLDVGFARHYYGIYSDMYDSRLMGSATIRWGATEKLTLEGHAEGGGGLINAGLGATFALGRNLFSTALAYSTYEGQTGYQLAGSYEVKFDGWQFYLRSQRTFGTYQDIAAVTATNPLTNDQSLLLPRNYARPAKAIDQLSLSFPVFDLGRFSVNLANIENAGGRTNRVASISHSRPLFGGTAFLSGYMDFGETSNYGIFLGFTRSFDNRISASLSSSMTQDGLNLVTELRRHEDNRPGSYGWRIVDSEGQNTYRGAAASYRGKHGRVEASVQQMSDSSMASAAAEGAIVVAGGDVFFANQINESFAVVDVGAPDVEVFNNNRSMGRTGRSGKIIVPQLQSHLANTVNVDPVNLPVHHTLAETSRRVIPARRSGVVVDFKNKAAGNAALVGFLDPSGQPIAVGSLLILSHSNEEYTIGYDGQVFLEDLKAHNKVEITLPNGQTCHAAFNFTPKAEQTFIEGVVCQ